MATKLQPLADRVIIRPIAKEEVTKGGIILPDTAKEKPQEGEIIAVGPGRLTEEGKPIKMDVKVGDRVIFAKYAGIEIKLDKKSEITLAGEELVILRESDILAKKV